MKHRAVGRRAAGKVMPLDDALKTLAAAGADDVHALAVVEDRAEHLIPCLRLIAAGHELHLAAHARRRHVRLLEMPRGRLVRLQRRLLDQAELHRLIAVVLRGLRLDDDARARLDDRGRMHGPVRIEDLSHADFAADDSSDHLFCPWSLVLRPWSVLRPGSEVPFRWLRTRDEGPRTDQEPRT